MLDFLTENLGTIIVSGVLAAIFSAIIAGMVKNKRQGKTSCSCGCANCPNSGLCHKK